MICDGPDDPAVIGPRTGCRSRAGDPLLRPIEAYRDAFRAHKASPGDVVVAAVTPLGEVAVTAGPSLAESCRLGELAGTPAIRLLELLRLFPDRNSWTTSCDQDWTDLLVQLAENLPSSIGYPCIDGVPIDRDPSAPGLQPDIAVWVEDAYGARSPLVLSACPPEPSLEPCYRLAPDVLNCGHTSSTLALVIEPPFAIRFPAYLRADIAVE